jgi:hypothetical protein
MQVMSSSFLLPKSAITQVNDLPGVFEIDLGKLCIKDLYVEITTIANGTSYLNFNEDNEVLFAYKRFDVKFKFKKNCDLPLTNKIRFYFHNDLQNVFKSISDTSKITLFFYDEKNRKILKDVRKGIDYIYDIPLTYQLSFNSIGSVELLDVNSVTDEQIDEYNKFLETADDVNSVHEVNSSIFGDYEEDNQTELNTNNTFTLKEEFTSNHNESDSLESQEEFSKSVNLNQTNKTSNAKDGIKFHRDYSYLEQRFNNKYPQNQAKKQKDNKGIFSWIKKLF